MTERASNHTPETVALALASEGLIQFGRFERVDGAIWPVAVRLRWLPSYPSLLRDTASALVPPLEAAGAERLLTTRDAIPLGVALSLHTGLPMTYPYGEVRDYTAAYAIEGAYDVGHPTVLLADVLVDAAHAEQITALARRVGLDVGTALARRVGLDVGTVLAVIDLGLGAREQFEALGYAVVSVLSLRDVLPVLETHDFLPPKMRATVNAWIDQGTG